MTKSKFSELITKVPNLIKNSPNYEYAYHELVENGFSPSKARQYISLAKKYGLGELKKLLSKKE